MLGPGGVEIRFECDSSIARVRLSCAGHSKIFVYHGLFQVAEPFSITEETRTLEIEIPERIQNLRDKRNLDGSFSPDVVRILPHGPVQSPMILHGVEGAGIRPPASNRLPGRRYLAYGTSITQGMLASGPHLSFPALVARRLGADLINLGSAGSCHCEQSMSDYIANREDWDIATLCVSTNMIGAGFSPAAFRERVDYLIHRVAETRADRPVVCIPVLPHFRDNLLAITKGNDAIDPEPFRRELRFAVADCDLDNVHIVDGGEILRDITGLTADLLHPSDHGMIEIAQRLGPVLEALLSRGEKTHP